MSSSSENCGLEIAYLEDLVFQDDYFLYRDKRHTYSEVEHVEFTATVTKHSVNFIPTGSSYDVNLFVHSRGQPKLHIEHRKGLFRLKQKEKFDAMMRAASILSGITFAQRVQAYEDQMNSRGFATWGRHQIGKNGDLFKDNELRFNINGGDIDFRLGPFHVECTKRKPSIGDRLKALWSGPPEVVNISIDRDCFIYIMKHYLGLSWASEIVPEKRLFGKDAFNRAMLILGAQLCKADGHVSPEEIAIFKQHFGIDDVSFPGAGKIFMDAVNSKQNIPELARQIHDVFDGKEEPLEYVLIGLFQIAAADGHIDDEELAIIRRVARVFGYTQDEVKRLYLLFSEAEQEHSGRFDRDEAHASVHVKYLTILGLAEGASFNEVKLAYRYLARQHHPDLLRAQGVPVDEIEIAEDILKVINDAYEWLSKNHYATSH